MKKEAEEAEEAEEVLLFGNFLAFHYGFGRVLKKL